MNGYLWLLSKTEPDGVIKTLRSGVVRSTEERAKRDVEKFLSESEKWHGATVEIRSWMEV